MKKLTRRECLNLMAMVPAIQVPAQKETEPADPTDWTCLMDPEVHLDHPGKCPRCGMTLVLKVPELVEYRLKLTAEPKTIRPGEEVTLVLRMADPNGKPVLNFDVVHEKLIHLFIVSEDLQFFAHVHPEVQPDHSFRLHVRLPKAGMYRLLADYFPNGATPQLTVKTLYVPGTSTKQPLEKSDVTPGPNLSARVRLEPEQLIAGLQSRLYYDLQPGEGLEKYLGAWGHMLIVSEDLVDLMHLHPFLAGGSTVQYNVIFPRPGKYKVWSQFQRLGTVNTLDFVTDVNGI